MTGKLPKSPYIGLIDDDSHSAHLFMRMFAANDRPTVRHYGDDAEGLQDLTHQLNDTRSHWPDLVVVDLKSHSKANIEFLRSHAAFMRQKGVGTVVMVPPVGRAACAIYYEAGAAAVYFRQPEVNAYRRELAALAEFWARQERLDAVGT